MNSNDHFLNSSRWLSPFTLAQEIQQTSPWEKLVSYGWISSVLGVQAPEQLTFLNGPNYTKDTPIQLRGQ
jgi:hypothetical protein